MKLKPAAATIIKDLGSSPDEIAATLAKWQIKGKQKDECACPIANHMTTQLAMQGFHPRVLVLGRAVLFYDKNKSEDEGFLDYVDLSLPAESFVEKFDKGKYKQLIEG